MMKPKETAKRIIREWRISLSYRVRPSDLKALEAKIEDALTKMQDPEDYADDGQLVPELEEHDW